MRDTRAIIDDRCALARGVVAWGGVNIFSNRCGLDEFAGTMASTREAQMQRPSPARCRGTVALSTKRSP